MNLYLCNHCTIIAGMPVIQRFPQCRVVINPKDHNPPHFHVLLNDGREVWVEIATVEIINGSVSAREVADILTWARANREMLFAKFEELQE